MNITKDQSKIIKAIAILGVVLYHFQYDMFGGSFLVKRGEGIFSWISNTINYISNVEWVFTGLPMYFGFIGVNVFLLLSGYGLAKKYFNKEKITFKDIFNQVLKILIPYWIAHPLMHLFDWILKSSLFLFGVIDYETHFWSMHTISRYLKSLLVFPRWLNEDYSMIFNGTWWFVGVIIQLYILFPFILYIFKKLKPKRALILCVLVSLIYRFLISIFTNASPVGLNEAHLFLFIIFPGRLAEFALGIYLAVSKKEHSVLDNIYFGFGMLILGFILSTFTYTMFASDLFFSLGGIIVLVKIAKKLSGKVQKVFEKIGEKSYYLYLYHEPLMKIVLKFIFPGWIDY